MGKLSGLVIAATGALETNQIKRWVEANGGRWSPRVDMSITHLIASRDAWKTVTDPVMKAAELNKHIVSFDWLEDSLSAKKRLAETKYTWEAITEDKKRRRALKKLGVVADGKKFLDGCRKIKELTGSGTSKKLPPAPRKPKPSKSFFYAQDINTPFVPAKEALMQRRAEREAADAAQKAARASTLR